MPLKALLDASFADEEQRVLQLSDGRIVFLPDGTGGRAYRIRDHRHGLRLSRQIVWVDRLATLAFVAVGIAAKMYREWTLFLFAIPALLAPWVSRRVVVWGLEEVTDAGARREVLLDDVVAPESAYGFEAPPPPQNKPIVPR